MDAIAGVMDRRRTDLERALDQRECTSPWPNWRWWPRLLHRLPHRRFGDRAFS